MLDHHERDQGFVHRHFDRLALARALAREQRGQQRGDHAVGAGLVGDDGRQEARLARHDALQRGQARSRLDDVVVRRLRPHRPGRAIAVGREIDQTRIDLLEGLVLHAQPLGRLGAIVVHQHVGGLGELEQRVAAGVLLEVEHDRALGAIAAEIEGRHAGIARRPELARGVAFGRFDFHHIGAQIAQLLRCPRPQHDRRAIENPNAGQRTRHVRFLFLQWFHSTSTRALEPATDRSRPAEWMLSAAPTYPFASGDAPTSPPTKQEAVMRGVVMKTILAAAIAGSSLLVATGANAHDRWDKWDRWERKHHKHHWKHSRGYGPPLARDRRTPGVRGARAPGVRGADGAHGAGLRLRRWRLPAGPQRELQLQLPALSSPGIMSGVWAAHDSSALDEGPLRTPPAKGEVAAG